MAISPFIGHPGEAYGLISDAYATPEGSWNFAFCTNGKWDGFSGGPASAYYAVEQDVFAALREDLLACLASRVDPVRMPDIQVLGLHRVGDTTLRLGIPASWTDEVTVRLVGPDGREVARPSGAPDRAGLQLDTRPSRRGSWGRCKACRRRPPPWSGSEPTLSVPCDRDVYPNTVFMPATAASAPLDLLVQERVFACARRQDRRPRGRLPEDLRDRIAARALDVLDVDDHQRAVTECVDQLVASMSPSPMPDSASSKTWAKRGWRIVSCGGRQRQGRADHCYSHLKAAKGLVVNIGSVASAVFPFSGVYCATKHAVWRWASHQAGPPQRSRLDHLSGHGRYGLHRTAAMQMSINTGRTSRRRAAGLHRRPFLPPSRTRARHRVRRHPQPDFV